jgi:hypothetical protein
VPPKHRYLEQVGGGVPEVVGRRARVVNFVERYELLAVDEAVTG